MTANRQRVYDGDEWQDMVSSWLRVRYAGEFERVPDEHLGDFGIEGFSRDGIAYQCHAPREPLKVADLYSRQRVKMTEDIGKFIGNSRELSGIFGDLKIKSWWFVVPENRSAKLQQHARKQEKLVRDAGLPYVTDAFYIHIADLADFQLERTAVLSSHVQSLRLDAGDASVLDVQAWVLSNSDLVSVLEDKIQRLLGPSATSSIVTKYRDELLKLYLSGQNKLEELRKECAELWEKAMVCRRDREKYVAMECATNLGENVASLQAQRKRLREVLSKSLPSLHESALEDIAYGMEGDWWAECSLDFPEPRGVE